MNRRSFLKTIAIASVTLAITPTDFLTPYSPPEQVGRFLTEEEFRELLEKYYFPEIIRHLKSRSKFWDKHYKKFLKEKP